MQPPTEFQWIRVTPHRNFTDLWANLLLEGEVTVTPDGGDPVKFGAGDLVIFPSTVAHNAPENKSDKRRTIVSFNIRGKVDKVKYQLWDGDPMVYVKESFAENTPKVAKTGPGIGKVKDPYAFKL